MTWEDWLRGRRARRQTSRQVVPAIARRSASSSDGRLRRLFGGQRGLPFQPTDNV